MVPLPGIDRVVRSLKAVHQSKQQERSNAPQHPFSSVVLLFQQLIELTVQLVDEQPGLVDISCVDDLLRRGGKTISQWR